MFTKLSYRTLEKWRNMDVMCGDRGTCDGCPHEKKYGDTEGECTERILFELGEVMRTVYADERCMSVLRLIAEGKEVVITLKEEIS